LAAQEIHKENKDEIQEEIVKLLSELPVEEKSNLLEYIKWRRDRLK
jgi:hypothetical protein